MIARVWPGSSKEAKNLDGSRPEAPISQVEPCFEDIYRGEIGYVVNSLRRLSIPERFLEDVAHETFVVVHRRLHTYDADRPLRPWLFGIAYRVASDFLRKGAHKKEMLVERLPAVRSDSEGSPHRQTERAQNQSLVIEALAELPPDQRAVFIQHDIEEYSAPQIAESLQIPLNTVYSRLRSGREKFERAVRQRRLIREER